MNLYLYRNVAEMIFVPNLYYFFQNIRYESGITVIDARLHSIEPDFTSMSGFIFFSKMPKLL